jgi:hypothetical protein
MKLYIFRTVHPSIIRSFSLYAQQCYMSYNFSPWSCSQAVSKSVWHIPLLCVQWKSPDEGQSNCLKHVEFHSKNKFEKLYSFQAWSGWNFLIMLASSQHNLYDIYHCCVYSEELLMMEVGTVRNTYNFIPRKKIEKLVHIVGFIVRI